MDIFKISSNRVWNMKTETETSKILLEIKLLSLIKLENNCL